MRPIHRWKSFWLGILVITFLAWAWRESNHRATTLSYRQFSITHASSGISITHLESGSPSSPLLEREYITAHTSDESWRQTNFGAPRFITLGARHKQLSIYYHEDPSNGHFTRRNAVAIHFHRLFFYGTVGSRALFLPHWLLITLFIIPWFLFLLWRSRRIRHLTKIAD